MKRRTFLTGCVGCAAAGVLGVSAFRKHADETLYLPLERPLKLAVMADIHYLAPTLTDHGPCFETVIRNADGKVMDYSEELAEAFVGQMLREKPDALLIAGDLTFNGEADSHRTLAQKLRRIAEAGVPVRVLPGNHDLDDPMAVRYRGESYERVRSIPGDEFAELYAPFGYADALSRDDASLSYTAELAPGLRVLLVDANTADAPGSIRQETLRWAKAQLKAARNAGARVIGVSHQSLLEHNAVFTSGFTAQNGDALAALYEKYGVLCNLCGHLHIQHILESGGGLPEIITSSLAVAPDQYGILTVSNAGMEYHTETLDVSAWANAQGRSDPDLLDFAGYTERFFGESSRSQAMEELSGRTDAGQLADFFAQVNAAYFAGRLDTLDRDTALWQTWNGLNGFLSVYLQSIRDDPARDSTTYRCTGER